MAYTSLDVTYLCHHVIRTLNLIPLNWKFCILIVLHRVLLFFDPTMLITFFSKFCSFIYLQNSKRRPSCVIRKMHWTYMSRIKKCSSIFLHFPYDIGWQLFAAIHCFNPKLMYMFHWKLKAFKSSESVAMSQWMMHTKKRNHFVLKKRNFEANKSSTFPELSKLTN